MTPRPPEPNPRRAGARRWRWLLALPLIVALFGAGWLLGRGQRAEPRPGLASSAAALPATPGSVAGPASVELRLDAAAVSLLPEGGLELRPWPPPDAAPPLAEAGSSPSAGSLTRP